MSEQSITAPPQALDKAGNELRPGDFIVYGHSVGRSSALRFGRIVSVNEKKARWDGYVGTTLTVWGVNDDYFDETSSFNRGATLLSKASTLQYTRRTLRIDRNCVSQTALKLLDEKFVELGYT